MQSIEDIESKVSDVDSLVTVSSRRGVAETSKGKTKFLIAGKGIVCAALAELQSIRFLCIKPLNGAPDV